MNWSWFQVLVVFVTPGLAYYHELSQRVFKVSLHPEANFGFSISSMSHSSKTKLVVGAPLADNIGQVYTCDLTENTTNICTIVSRANVTRFTEVDDRYNDQNYWYGATVKGTENFFVACSPLKLDKISGYDKRVGTFGQCYLYKDPTKYPERLASLSKDIRKKYSKKFEDIMDSFGWSLDIDSENSISVGGPAMISGRLIKIKTNQVSYTYGEKQKKVSFNFGYGVASGLFLALTKLSVAVGSPYGTDGHGKVLFLDENMTARKELLSPVVGSMFGAVLCTATLSRHRKNADLLVGAPAYADPERYSVGAVYVYIVARKVGREHIYKRMIVGAMSQSYFGNAIVSVGDLNGDEIDEIAIAAPYENEGRGAVYLYSGQAIMNEGDINYLQKILPEPTLKGFGFSLAALRDYDDNGCNELAIGIPGSNQVKVLRCMAAITIELERFKYEMPGFQRKGKDETRTLPVCITAKFPDKPVIVKADIQVKILIKHDGARLNDPIADSQVTIKIRAKQRKYCENISLFMSGTTGNYNKKIMYGLSAALKDNVVNHFNFNGSEVVLSERSILDVKDFMIVQECGDKLCEPKLKMNTKFSEESSEYELGSSPSIDAAVWVSNMGDVAYDACVRVSVTGTSVPRPPHVCRAIDSADRELECKPKQALRQGNPPWIIETISLNTTSLTNENKSIIVNVTLYKTCETLEVADQLSKEIQLIADAKSIHVEGRTNEGVDDLVNLTRSDIEAHKSFQHVYTIINSGRTNWVNVKMSVIVQTQDYVTRSVFLEEEKCKLIKTDLSNEEYSCVAPSLNKYARFEVKVIMQVVPNELNNVIGKGKITVYSTIDVQLDNTAHPGAKVTSELRLVEGVVPIWIIIAASILALIILLIIFFILRECGFLERKNKEELRRARMSVRRQTMMRQSMNRPQSQDQQKLVEDNEAALSHEKKTKKKDRRVVINDD